VQSDLLDRPYSLPTGGSWSGGGPWPSAESAFRVHCQCTTWMLSTAQLTELPLGHPHWPGDGNSQLCCGGSRLWPSTVAVDFGPARWPSVCGRDVRRPAACGRDVRPAAGGVRRRSGGVRPRRQTVTNRPRPPLEVSSQAPPWMGRAGRQVT